MKNNRADRYVAEDAIGRIARVVYDYGSLVVAAEASPLADRRGRIDGFTPLLIYMNSAERSTEYGGGGNSLYVMDWKRSYGTNCQ